MQPIFETSLKDNGTLSRIQIFEIISSYGLIIYGLIIYGLIISSFEGFDILLISRLFVYFSFLVHVYFNLFVVGENLFEFLFQFFYAVRHGNDGAIAVDEE